MSLNIYDMHLNDGKGISELAFISL